MQKSDSIIELSKALCKFQAEVKNPANTATNPFFKSKYAPLNEILNDVRPILSKHGLVVLQSPGSEDGEHITITTLLLHESGEWIQGAPLTLKAEKMTPQGAGICTTYGRRYALSALLGISSEDDDDGQGAEAKKPAEKPAPTPPKPAQTKTITPSMIIGDPISSSTVAAEQQQAVQSTPTTPARHPKPVNFPAFWAECKKIGYTEAQVHEYTKCDSLKDWTREQLASLMAELKGIKANEMEGK